MVGNSGSDYDHQHTTDFLFKGESSDWFYGCKVDVHNAEYKDGNYEMRCTLTFPWGYSCTWWFWTGGWVRLAINSENSEETFTDHWGRDHTYYDGRYKYADYNEYVVFECTSAADFGSDEAVEILIQHETRYVNKYFVDPRFGHGSDANKGVNWDEAWRSINKAATTVSNGDYVYIASGYDESVNAEWIGDHRRTPGYNNQITPINAGFPGIWYVLDDPRDLTNNASYAALLGTLTWDLPLYNHDFEYTSWGSWVSAHLWGDDGTGFSTGDTTGLHGYYASKCSFVDSDTFLDTHHYMPRLIDYNNSTRIYTGNSLVLGAGWVFDVLDLGNDKTTVHCSLKKDGTEMDDIFLDENETYVYTANFDSVDIPIIVIQAGLIFLGTETISVEIKGIFQVKDEVWDYTPPG